jgi:hypothetical protein
MSRWLNIFLSFLLISCGGGGGGGEYQSSSNSNISNSSSAITSIGTVDAYGNIIIRVTNSGPLIPSIYTYNQSECSGYYDCTGQSPGKWMFDGMAAPEINFQNGKTYRFVMDDNSNNGHTLNFSSTPDGTHSGQMINGEWIGGIHASWVKSWNSAFKSYDVTISSSTPSPLYYYCSQHPGEGNGTPAQKPPSSNATSSGLSGAGGVWMENNEIKAISTDDGEFYFTTKYQAIGTLSVIPPWSNNNQSFNGSFTPKADYLNNINLDECSAWDGIINERQSITMKFVCNGTWVGEAQGYVNKGDPVSTTPPDELSFTYSTLYEQTSSLSKIAGNYEVQMPTTQGNFLAIETISGAGVRFMQIGSCVLNGNVSILNSNYGIYRITETYSSECGHILGGKTFTGIALLDIRDSSHKLIKSIYNESYGPSTGILTKL